MTITVNAKTNDIREFADHDNVGNQQKNTAWNGSQHLIEPKIKTPSQCTNLTKPDK